MIKFRYYLIARCLRLVLHCSIIVASPSGRETAGRNGDCITLNLNKINFYWRGAGAEGMLIVGMLS